jgi:hypothetical protein
VCYTAGVPAKPTRRPSARTRPDPDELLSPGQVAALAGVTEGAIRAWRLWRGLPAITVGTHHVFRRGDVERWLAQRAGRLSAHEARGRRLPPGVGKLRR